MIKTKNIFIFSIIIYSLFSCSSIEPQKSINPKKDYRIDWFNYNYFFLEAIKQKVLGNYQEAINNYSSALKIDPTQAVVYYEIAGLLSLNKDFSGALEYARKAVDKDKTGNIYFKLLLAKTYKDNNQPANAAAILEEILKVQPDDFLLYFELSKTYQELKKYSQAIRIMNVAERKFGIIEQISLEKEKIYFLIGDKNKAVKEIERLAASFPSNINYKALLAETYVNNGMIDKAQKILNEIENETFEDGIVYLSIAEFYRLIGEYNKTMEFVRIAFESENVELDIKVKLLISFLDVMGTDKEFIGEIGKLIQIISEMYPNEIKVRAVSADFYIITRNYQKAQKELDYIVSVDKEKYDIWNQLINIDYYLNDLENMYRHSKEAVSLFPNLMEFYRFYIVSAYATQNYRDVVEAVDYVSSVPFYNQAIMMDFLHMQAESFYKLGEYEKSDSVYEEILFINSEDLSAINNYSYFLALRNQKIDRALELSELLIEKEGTNPNYLDTRAYVLMRAKKYEDALKTVDEALLIEPDNRVFLEHKGDILFHLNQSDEAIKYWQMARDKSGNSEILIKKIETGKFVE